MEEQKELIDTTIRPANQDSLTQVNQNQAEEVKEENDVASDDTRHRKYLRITALTELEYLKIVNAITVTNIMIAMNEIKAKRVK